MNSTRCVYSLNAAFSAGSVHDAAVPFPTMLLPVDGVVNVCVVPTTVLPAVGV